MKCKLFSLTVLLFLNFSLKAQSAFETRTVGEGDPILLFPGFTCTDEVWSELVKKYSKSNELHLFTFAGFGEVEPIDTPWFETIKVQVEEYISNQKLQEASIVGHSMGGTLALWLASENPDWFNKLVIVDALPSMGALMIPDYNPENLQYNSPYNRQMLEMNDEQFRQNANNMANFMCADSSRHEQLITWAVETDRKTYVYGFTDLLKVDLREDLAKIEKPVLVLGATYPQKEQIEVNYKKQYEKLSSKTIVYPEQGSRHFIMWDQPQWFLDQVDSFLRP